MTDDTDQPTTSNRQPDRRNDPAEPDDRTAEPDPDDAFLAPPHPTDAELAQREQDRELESGEENPG